MCLAAIYWARCDRVVFGATAADAAAAGFDDARLYREVAATPAQRALPMSGLLRESALESFALWRSLPGKTPY
jgi:tRNA(Arg) A34 adenosine deaminase TadA